MTLPNLFIPGAEKGATSTLAMLLHTHQDVYTGKRGEVHMGKWKEPQFFSLDSKYFAGTEFYKKHYAYHQGQKIVLDSSPSYMHLDFVPRRILETLGDSLRFIFVLRNPVDRVVSAFAHVKVNLGWEVKRDLIDIIPEDLADITLDELLHYEEKSVRDGLRFGTIQSKREILLRYGFPCRYFYVSCYSKHISNYFRYFPKENFLFLTFEEVTQTQQSTKLKIAEFLGIDPGGFGLNRNVHSNPTLVYKNKLFKAVRPIRNILKNVLPRNIGYQLRILEIKCLMEKPQYRFSDSIYQYLLKIFQPEIEKTERITDLNLSSWKIGF